MNFLHQEPRKVVSFAVFKSRLLIRISQGVCGLLDFIPGLFRLSVTFYNFIHFLKKQTVYTYVVGTQFLGHSPCSSGDVFSFSVAPHTLHSKVFICKDWNKKHIEGTDAQSMKPIFILSDSQIFFKYV